MQPTFDAVIIGGGLAGSTCAILLKEKGWNVLVLERSHYPRHKVCGEFLSGGVWPFLERLGAGEKILLCSPQKIHSVSFSLPGKAEIVSRLRPSDAYGISRKNLDLILLDEARANGAEVQENTEAQSIRNTENGFEIDAWDVRARANKTLQTRFVINAAGKSHRWQDSKAVHERNSRKRIGFKAHFSRADLYGSTRLFFFQGGYLGLAPVEGGITNLCGLVESKTLIRNHHNFDELLDSIAAKDKNFKIWLEKASRKGEWVSCGPVYPQYREAYRDGVFFTGDACGFLEPFMGQGMTAAIVSGFLLSSLLDNVPSAHEFPGIRKKYEALLKEYYRSKLFIGSLVRFFSSSLDRNSIAVKILHAFPSLVPLLVEHCCSLEIPLPEILLPAIKV